jgi:hypothetical protein
MLLQRLLATLSMVMVLAYSSADLMAQTNGRLYDPEPPADSAYIRIVLAGDMLKVAVSIDGKLRIPSVSTNQASDYLVIPAGRHLIELQTPGKLNKLVSMPLEVIQGRAITLVFTSSQMTEPPIVLEDKTGSNKLKAMLSVYQLASKQKALDVTTSDGKTKVFSNLEYGKSAALAVNPISTELQIQYHNEAAILGKTSISMSQGNSYSIVLFAEKTGKVKSVVVQNKVERYTGK